MSIDLAEHGLVCVIRYCRVFSAVRQAGWKVSENAAIPQATRRPAFFGGQKPRSFRERQRPRSADRRLCTSFARGGIPPNGTTGLRPCYEPSHPGRPAKLRLPETRAAI